MRVFLCVCFATVLVFTADGETDPEHTRLCGGIPDFDLCSGDWNCKIDISRCFCKDETPFCRCNNFADEFYLGEDCNQKWTTLTFALVASLPGVILALVVGLTVHMIHTFSKSKSNSPRERNKVQSSSPAEEDMFPGIVFASDMTARHNGPRPAQGGIQMETTSPYSQSASLRPSADRPQMGGPRPPNSAFDKPALGGHQQPYSYTARPGQVLSNPYAKSRNPYEEGSPLPNSYRSNNLPASPQAYDDRRMGQSSARSYPEYSNHSAFPRVYVNRIQ